MVGLWFGWLRGGGAGCTLCGGDGCLFSKSAVAGVQERGFDNEKGRMDEGEEDFMQREQLSADSSWQNKNCALMHR